MDTNFDKKSVKALKKAMLCSSDNAKKVLEIITCESSVKLPFSARKNKEESDKSIIITDNGGTEYKIGINKKFSVYSIKNSETGEYVYAVYE